MEASNAPISSLVPGIVDTTSRSICNTFDKYIYLYELSAQLSRIVYCDSGIIKKLMPIVGSDNYAVMKQINALDHEFKAKKGTPLESQKDRSIIPGIPHESYALGKSHEGGVKYGTYISTADVLTALILDTSVIKTPKGPFQEKDILLSFKGTSTFAEAIHDLKSVVSRADLVDVLKSIGISYGEKGSILNAAFTGPLTRAWNILIRGLTEHSEKYDSFRLFCIGHSLGGAYCTLFGFLLGLIKTLPDQDSPTFRLVKRITSIHIISLGSPTICSDKARNTFNELLDNGSVTLDRLVTQLVPTLTVHTVGTDFVPTIPAFFSHPGYKPSAVSIAKDVNRPYSLVDIYKRYGTGSPKKYLVEVAETSVQEAALEKELEGISEPVQKGGFGMHKGKYSAVLSKRSSNFISIPAQGVGGSVAPHLVYLGMRYLGALRLPGWKNPVPPRATKCAYFGLYDNPSEGVDIQYVECITDAAASAAAAVSGMAEENKSKSNAAFGRAANIASKYASSEGLSVAPSVAPTEATAAPTTLVIAGKPKLQYTRKVGKHIQSLLLGGKRHPRKTKKKSKPSFRQKCLPPSRK